MSPGSSIQKDGARLQGEERERYVESLFDRIASPYDRLNRIISLGRDRAWRRRVVSLSGVSPGQHVCDLGTGTGDLALAFADALGRDGIVVGADLSAGMLHQAGSKLREAGHETIHLVRASAAASGLPDGWARAVCMGWVLRNVGDRPEVYREIRRLLEPGGRFVTIDMSRPRGRLARCGFWIYRHAVMPVMIRLLGGDFQAYRYLAASTDRFPDAPDLEAELATAGFQNVHHVPLMGGAVAIHVATK